MQQSPVFEQTYQHYISEIRQIDFLARADLLGAKVENGALVFSLYDKTYVVSGDGVAGYDGEKVIPAVRVILCKYVLTCPAELPEMTDRLMTYREFKDAGPLISYFTTNTNKTIESTFSGKLESLRKRALQLGAETRPDQSYDLSMLFHALPRIPVILNFNDRDEQFSATCSILYKASAESFLDMECLAMTGTLLTGKLLET